MQKKWTKNPKFCTNLVWGGTVDNHFRVAADGAHVATTINVAEHLSLVQHLNQSVAVDGTFVAAAENAAPYSRVALDGEVDIARDGTKVDKRYFREENAITGRATRAKRRIITPNVRGICASCGGCDITSIYIDDGKNLV